MLIHFRIKTQCSKIQLFVVLISKYIYCLYSIKTFWKEKNSRNRINNQPRQSGFFQYECYVLMNECKMSFLCVMENVKNRETTTKSMKLNLIAFELLFDYDIIWIEYWLNMYLVRGFLIHEHCDVKIVLRCQILQRHRVRFIASNIHKIPYTFSHSLKIKRVVVNVVNNL